MVRELRCHPDCVARAEIVVGIANRKGMPLKIVIVSFFNKETWEIWDGNVMLATNVKEGEVR